MRRRVALLAACAALGFPVAGCGAGTESSEGANAGAYVRQVNAAQIEFARRFGGLSERIGPTLTPAQGRRTLGAFERAVDGTVTRLRRVRPPEQVAGLHGRLVGEIASYGDQIAVARRAFSSRDPQRVLAAQGKLVDAVRQTSADINRTIDAINRQLRA